MRVNAEHMGALVEKVCSDCSVWQMAEAEHKLTLTGEPLHPFSKACEVCPVGKRKRGNDADDG